MTAERVLSGSSMPLGILTVSVLPAVIQKQRLGSMQLFARKEVVEARFMMRIKWNTLLFQLSKQSN